MADLGVMRVVAARVVAAPEAARVEAMLAGWTEATAATKVVEFEGGAEGGSTEGEAAARAVATQGAGGAMALVMVMRGRAVVESGGKVAGTSEGGMAGWLVGVGEAHTAGVVRGLTSAPLRQKPNPLTHQKFEGRHRK